MVGQNLMLLLFMINEYSDAKISRVLHYHKQLIVILQGKGATSSNVELSTPLHSLTNRHCVRTKQLLLGKSLKIRDFKEVILVTESPAELNAAEDGELECCVCLSRLEEGNGTRKLACCHLFHRECVDRWLVHCRSTCPLCRLSINCEPMKREMEQTEELMIWFSSYYAPGF